MWLRATSRYKPTGRAIPLSGNSRSHQMPLTALDNHSVSWPLSREPAQVRHARNQARKTLFDWGLGEHAELAALIVSELVTNAIRHGAGPIRVRVSRACGDLRVEVHDHGAGRPVWRQPADDDESGRGLALLDALIGLHGGRREVTSDAAGPGKTVYVVICLPPDLAGARSGVQAACAHGTVKPGAGS
jgi:signal transduction histidine kinase